MPMPHVPASSTSGTSPRRMPGRRPMSRLAATLCAGAASLALCNAMAQTTAPQPRPQPEGRWLSANGNVEVDVARCGPAWCGTIARVLSQQSMSRPGEVMTPVDTRPALGMTILKDFVADDAGQDAHEGATQTAWRGHIYNRENGKTYRCLMSLDTSGNLVLRPYVGLPIFGQTQVWRRVAATQEGQP